MGDVAILDALRGIAPVTAIRGNVDVSGACAELPATDVVELDGKAVLFGALGDGFGYQSCSRGDCDGGEWALA